MKELRVVIDAGHGGTFNGAMGKSRRGLTVSEAHITAEFAETLRQNLNARGDEVVPYFAPRATSTDLNEDLERRANFANQLRADCFVSLHCNWFSDPRVRGFEVFTSPGQTRADALAELVIEELVRDALNPIQARVDTSDGDRDKEARFAVLTRTKCPAVLIELGFISNPHELKTLRSSLTQHAMTFSITEAILKWAREG